MSVDAGVEVRRPRPVSAGLWTLFSWLRRDERSSTESVSSAGSDRTVASFAFISPAHYRPTASAEPTALPPLGPPTDTYKKRIHERNLRLQREHDLTLHRKYGLFKGDSTSRYNTFSSPSARTGKGEAYDKLNRERRASSESGQRRSAYVAGKRRAPPPPVYAAATSSLNRRTRKRPAPQPPMNTNDAKLKSLMTSKSASGSNNLETTDNCLDCKYEKYSKADVSKECKSRTEKNFLKQIFEGKKGKSTVVSALGRLPNISELDREAAEIIKMRRDYSGLNSNSMLKGDSWFCTTCLRKYDPSTISCLNCVQDVKNNKSKDENESSNVPSTSTQGSDRQQLKKMLKEMKDSIPKKSKLIDSASRIEKKAVDQQNTKFIGSDTPTLQMQWSMKANDEKKSVGKQSSQKIHRDPENRNVNFINNNILVTQTVVIQSPPNNMCEINSRGPTFNDLPKTLLEDNVGAPDISKVTNLGERDSERKSVSDTKQMNKTQHNLPMRISCLLNPVSIPRSNDKQDQKNLIPSSHNNSQNYVIKQTEPMNRDVKNVEDKRINITDILQTNRNIKYKTTLNTSSLDTPPNHVVEEIVSINKDVKNFEKKVHTAYNSQSNSNVIKEIESNKDVKNVDKLVNTVDVSQFNNPDLDSKIILKTLLPSNPQNHIIQENDSIHSDVKNVEETVNIAHVSQTNSGLSNQIILETAKPHNSSVGSGSINKDVKDDVLQANSNIRNRITLKTSLPSTSKDVNVLQKKSEESVLTPKPTIGFLSSDSSKEAPAKSPSDNIEQITPAVLVSKNEGMNRLEDGLAKPYTFLMDSGLPKPKSSNANMAPLEQHSKRRELINILEKSIAKGDERSAADAAAKLAQLRLSCSVLSFSSNIVRENTAPSSVTNPNIANTPQTDEPPINGNVKGKCPAKVDTGTQSVATGAPVENKQNLAKTVLTKPIACEKNPIKKPTCTDDSKPSTSRQGHENKLVSIKVWVEDRVAARGPVLLRLPQHAVMGELRRVAETTLGLASHLQRWIVGRALCTDDNATLTSLAGPELSLPFYLCLVESDSTKTSHQSESSNANHSKVDVGAVYTELMQLEQRSIITNAEAFQCEICMDNCAEGDGAVLRECVHSFCKNCLADVVRHSGEPVVACPANDCNGFVQEREIRALMPPDEYEKWLARSLAAAESGTRHSFHCRTPDCIGWALCEPGVRRFPCPVCKHINCVPCQAIHESETCERYRAKLKEAEIAIEADETDEGTRQLFESLISKGEALECPECRAMITKKWGCDWVKCFACKTEICWVTRGRRWGPGGRGDTSGGCRCGVDGKRCHPSCGYCH